MSSNLNYGFYGWNSQSVWGTNGSPEFKSRWISNKEIIQILRGRKIEKTPLIKYIKRLSNDDLLTILNSITERLVTNRTIYGSLTRTLYTPSNSELFVLAEYLRRYRIKKEIEEKKERIKKLSDINHPILGRHYSNLIYDDLEGNVIMSEKDFSDILNYMKKGKP